MKIFADSRYSVTRSNQITAFEFNGIKKNVNKYSNSQSDNLAKPVIFVSACEDSKSTGGYKFNGGINEYNCLVKILRQHGYEAYIVTYDGNYEPWLIEHQPHISINNCRQKIKSLQNVRCVTSWAVAKAFINECEKLYFWDMELLFTDNDHFSTIANLYRIKIIKTASISRTIQAWHMANFRKPCVIIPNLLDESYWNPDEKKRIFNRVGYMNEGPHTEQHITLFKDAAKSAGLQLDFIQIKGETKEVISGMQSCNLFLSMNQGKDPLWGEGCPRTIIEAMSAGSVVLAYDIIGNREMIVHSFNGIIVPRYRSDIMAKEIIDLYQKPSEIERLRGNGLNIIHSCHTSEARWPAIKEFLDL
ncbi:glycosyltransferase [Methanosarcina lacustris]|nr:glycosyltransferase [Methanosarcina lacustris]